MNFLHADFQFLITFLSNGSAWLRLTKFAGPCPGRVRSSAMNNNFNMRQVRFWIQFSTQSTFSEQVFDFEFNFQPNRIFEFNSQPKPNCRIQFRTIARTIASACVRTIVWFEFEFLIVAACPRASRQGNKVEFDSGGAPFFEANFEAPFFLLK